MNTLKTRIEKIETALRAGVSEDWFSIVKENGVERAQVILAARGMTTELETLRAMLAEAHERAERWERETFGEIDDA